MMRQYFWILLFLQPIHSQALDYNFDKGITVAVDSTITWGAQWRMEDRDPSISGRGFVQALQLEPFLPLTDATYSEAQTVIINGNDGNNSFDTGLVSHRLTFLFDVDANWKNYGIFLRGKAFYDQIYQEKNNDLNTKDLPTYNSGTLYGGETRLGQYPGRARDAQGSRLEILDAFVYTTWELPGERLLDLRIGRQVINWGESTFYQGINSIQNRVDAAVANIPGVEIKEIMLPTGAIFAQGDLTSNLTMETYYQYEWIGHDLNGVGSYFATEDQVGPGANAFIIPTPNSSLVPENIRGNEYHLRGIPRTSDDDAKDSGQWGVGLHFLTAGNWDLGFFHVQSHDKKPSFVLDYITVPGSPQPVPTSYKLRYYENIKATAASFTTVIGETNVQGELSFLDGTPMVNATGDPQRESLLKFQIGGSHVFGPTFLADDTNLIFEGFYAQVTSEKASALRADNSAWGYSLLSEFNYYNALQGWDVKIPVYIKHDVAGTVRELQVYQGSKVVSLGITGTYLNNFSANLAYSLYFGGGDANLLQDRDHLALTIKYSF